MKWKLTRIMVIWHLTHWRCEEIKNDTTHKHLFLWHKPFLIRILISLPIISCYQEMKLLSAFFGLLLLIFIRPKQPQYIVLMRSLILITKNRFWDFLCCCYVLIIPSNKNENFFFMFSLNKLCIAWLDTLNYST